MNPSEMMWIQEHGSHITDICAAFRTPPGVAGDYGDASRIANLGGMHRLFAEICVRPELTLIEDALNWQLLWAEDWGMGLGWEREHQLFLAHDLAGISMFREDETSRSARAATAFSSGAKWDEVRAMHGLDPVGGKLGDTSFVQANLVPVDSLIGESGDEEGDTESGLGGVSEAAAVTEGNPATSNPPNTSEVREPKQPAEASEAVKALALLEKKQYRKWRKTHNSGKFNFKYLGESEQGDLDAEIRGVLSEVRQAIGE
jgi:hypothetical protein